MSARGPRPSRPWLAAAALALASVLPAQTPAPAPDSPQKLLDRLQQAWKARDAQAYLRLWDFPNEAARQEETAFAADRLDEEETLLDIQRPRPDAGPDELVVQAYAFGATEPRGRVEQWRLRLGRVAGAWAIKGRETLPGMEGLVHLSLDPAPFRADGLTLRLEDFELTMHSGVLFAPPVNLGPTALVFVGRATVKVQPRPETERAQLRQFSGAPEMVDEVRAAFVRLHPADLHRVLIPARFEPRPADAGAWGEAERFYREHASRSFLLDASLPRSPWWLMPGLGDASVTVRTKRRGTLTYTVSSNEAEGISFFDRARRRQILLYPQQGRDPHYNEDDGRLMDVLDHELSARLDPVAVTIQAEDTLRVRVLMPVSTIRLRLNDELRVESITSPQGGQHLFFRVRGQDSLMVSMGPLAGATGELSLTVRYAGPLRTTTIERESIAMGPSQDAQAEREEEVVVEPVTVLTNQWPWYPQGANDDFATGTFHLDVPQGVAALTGGTSQGIVQSGNRTRFDYRLDQPGKYFSVALGRFTEVGRRQVGPVALEAWSVGRTRNEAARFLDQAGDILAFYEELFGPCPFPVLRLAFFEARTPGGHSPPGMILLAQRPAFLPNALRDDPASFQDVPGFFFAHELAHQWWGHGVAGQNYRERWLSEAFAQYAAALWAQKRHGPEVFAEVLSRLQRWALAKNEEGPISLGYRLGHIKQDQQIYRAVVYDKGAYVLHMLRGIVGPAAFTEGLRTFQASHRFQKAGTDDLRQALEKASGRDLAPYFQSWVYGTKLPRLTVKPISTAAGLPFRSTLEIEADGLPGPVPLTLGILHDGGRETRLVTLEPTGGRFSVETPRPLRRVDVNDDRGLLARIVRQ